MNIETIAPSTLNILPFINEQTIIDISASADDGTRLLYDRKEAARQLSISVRSLDYLIANKKLGTRRIGKKVLIPYGDLKRFASANHFDSVLVA